MSMRLHYEALVLRCFDNCEPGKDPKQLGSANTYDNHIIEVGFEIKEGASYSLKEAVSKVGNLEARNKLETLRTAVWRASTQEEFNCMLKEAHAILDQENIGFNPTLD